MTTADWAGRLGILAATLAAGSILGLGTAAVACAAPADTTSGPAADAPAPPRRATAPRATHRAERAAARPDSARTGAAKPAAASSAGGAVPRPAATHSEAPKPQEVPATPPSAPKPQTRTSPVRLSSSPTVPIAPVPAAAQTAPGSVVTPRAVAAVAPVTVQPPGRRTTIVKGTHFAIPIRWRMWVTKAAGDATFTTDSAYDLKDADQYDWNKLAGITFTPWRPNEDAGMVVWRYNLNNGRYEVGPFFNDNFAFVFPTDAEIISLAPGQTFGYSVDYTGITITYGDRTVFKPYPQDLKPNFWTSANVSGWFGGNETAPRTLSYYLRAR